MADPLDTLRRAYHSPGGKLVLSLAEQLLSGHKRYEAEHWGKKSRGARLVEAAESEGPLVLVGALSRVSYITQKGLDEEWVEYEHDFSEPYPWLYHTPEGELVIVRGDSLYRMRDRGITG